MTNSNSKTICSGSTIGIALTSNVASTYSWSAAANANTTGETTTASATTTINDVIVNSTTSIQTVTYTVTPTSTLGSCVGTSQAIIVTVNPTTTPTFTQVGPYCSGATIPALPTTSNNGITGTWSPALNNTATTTYTFTPTAGQCASTATMTITVNPSPVMTNISSKTICSGSTVGINLTSNMSYNRV
jgi:hypothetical protein